MDAADYDVGIIGGGPAGSAMGAYLAKSGVRCAIYESELFPRPHVGESLVPASTRVFKELGFLPEMERLGFLHKYGASWSSSAKTRPYQMGWEGLDQDCQVAVRFAEREQPGVDQNYTYHVDRGQFDLALLKHAESAGAKVMSGVAVKAVHFAGELPELLVGLGRKEVRQRVRIVIDASGRRALVGRQLKLMRTDPTFDQYAVHSWFRGFDRHALPNPDHIHIHFLPLRNAWVWQIPIDADTTSIGLVMRKADFKASRGDHEGFFLQCLAGRPDIAALLQRAERIRPLKQEADYSYSMTQMSGDGFLLLGDAARFVDPIFSSGVSIALNSARLAAPDVIAALAAGSYGRGAYSRFESTMKRGVRNWYDFIHLYYRLNVMFTQFVGDRRYRLDVLKLLQGDVYDDEQPAVLEQMRRKLAEVEGNPQHRWHHLLSELAAGGAASRG